MPLIQPLQRRVLRRDSAIPRRSFCLALVLLNVNEKPEVQQVVQIQNTSSRTSVCVISSERVKIMDGFHAPPPKAYVVQSHLSYICVLLPPPTHPPSHPHSPPSPLSFISFSVYISLLFDLPSIFFGISFPYHVFLHFSCYTHSVDSLRSFFFQTSVYSLRSFVLAGGPGIFDCCPFFFFLHRQSGRDTGGRDVQYPG